MHNNHRRSIGRGSSSTRLREGINVCRACEGGAGAHLHTACRGVGRGSSSTRCREGLNVCRPCEGGAGAHLHTACRAGIGRTEEGRPVPVLQGYYSA